MKHQMRDTNLHILIFAVLEPPLRSSEGRTQQMRRKSSATCVGAARQSQSFRESTRLLASGGNGVC